MSNYHNEYTQELLVESYTESGYSEDKAIELALKHWKEHSDAYLD